MGDDPLQRLKLIVAYVVITAWVVLLSIEFIDFILERPIPDPQVFIAIQGTFVIIVSALWVDRLKRRNGNGK